MPTATGGNGVGLTGHVVSPIYQAGSRQNNALQHQVSSSIVTPTLESQDGGRHSNTSSIIAEMHYQKGMSDIKSDLQRKIVSYQTILKKTYAQAEREKQTKKKVSSNRSKDRDSSGRQETPTSLAISQKRKASGLANRSSAAMGEQRC